MGRGGADPSRCRRGTKAAQAGVVIEELEADQQLQAQVLTAYHLMTIAFEKSQAIKMIHSASDRKWIKNWVGSDHQYQSRVRKVPRLVLPDIRLPMGPLLTQRCPCARR